MPGAPKKRRLIAALEKRAQAEIGEGATALEYLEHFIASGGFFEKLAEDLAVEMAEPVTRTFLSKTAHDLDPRATDRLDAARRASAPVQAERAVVIADAAPETTAGVAKARLQSDNRKWLAERLDPSAFGQKASVTFDVSALYLDALKRVNAESKASDGEPTD
jgi:hypothetical protein